MALTSLAQYKTSVRQNVSQWFTSNLTISSGSLTDIASWVSLGGASTTAGVTQTKANLNTIVNGSSYEKLEDFPAGTVGYITKAVTRPQMNSATSFPESRGKLFDCLWKAGAYNFDSNVTLSAWDTTWNARVPDSDYGQVELWVEAVTGFTGNPTINITYTNEAGVTGRTTSLVFASAPTARRMERFPLAAGDKGVQKVESVVASVATVGTFNLLLLRRLGPMLLSDSQYGANPVPMFGRFDMMSFGLPQIDTNACLMFATQPGSTSSGLPYLELEVTCA